MQTNNEKRIESLKSKREQIDAELSRLQAQARQEARKTDTRRKILIGAVVLQAMQTEDKWQAAIQALLAKKLTKDRDRALFDLPALSPANDDNTLSSDTQGKSL